MVINYLLAVIIGLAAGFTALSLQNSIDLLAIFCIGFGYLMGRLDNGDL